MSQVSVGARTGVTTDAVGDAFEKGGAFACAGVFNGVPGGLIDREYVVAIDFGGEQMIRGGLMEEVLADLSRGYM